ncbi:MAG: hypothetical protein ACI8ZX_001635 [Planctomycetota bacterium]
MLIYIIFLHKFVAIKLKKRTMKKIIMLLVLPILLVGMSSCGEDSTGVFLFSIQDDIDLGAKVDAEIKSDPATYPILARSTNVQAYAYLDAMRDDILNGGKVKFQEEFAWELNIIDDNTTLNAFCTPGGYIYVYSGLIKYLENSSSLAGVMGHEIAHADRRHSSSQMQKNFGVSTLLSLLSGNETAELLGQVAGSLTSLAFSRADEKQADEYSVTYLCPTSYDAAGAANFFAKIDSAGGSSVPAFLSTHPSPDNRVANIHADAAALTCGTDEADPTVNGMTYADFQALF